MMKRGGFTLTELLVTIAVMGIIAATTVPAYGAMRRSVTLNAAVRQLVSTLREAQNKSITSQDNAQFGVKFSGTSYTLYNTTPTDIRTVYTGISITGATDIKFNRLSGNVPTQATVNLGTKTITVSTSGLISVS